MTWHEDDEVSVVDAQSSDRPRKRPRSHSRLSRSLSRDRVSDDSSEYPGSGLGRKRIRRTTLPVASPTPMSLSQQARHKQLDALDLLDSPQLAPAAEIRKSNRLSSKRGRSPQAKEFDKFRQEKQLRDAKHQGAAYDVDRQAEPHRYPPPPQQKQASIINLSPQRQFSRSRSRKVTSINVDKTPPSSPPRASPRRNAPSHRPPRNEPVTVDSPEQPARRLRERRPPMKSIEHELDLEDEVTNLTNVDEPYTGPTTLIFNYPPGERGKIEITEEERSRLQDNRYLNDSLIDFYIKYLQVTMQNRADNMMFFSSFFFNRLRREKPIDYSGVKGWTKGVDVFTKRFVFIPICDSYHWSLIIVANLHKLPDLLKPPLNHVAVTEKIDSPKIIYLDSLDPKRGLEFAESVRSYLEHEFVNRRLKNDAPHRLKATSSACRKHIEILRPNVPVQTNEVDCGLYLLKSIQLFMYDDDRFRFKLLSGERDLKGAYVSNDISALRWSIIDVINRLGEDWKRTAEKQTEKRAGQLEMGDKDKFVELFENGTETPWEEENNASTTTPMSVPADSNAIHRPFANSILSPRKDVESIDSSHKEELAYSDEIEHDTAEKNIPKLSEVESEVDRQQNGSAELRIKRASELCDIVNDSDILTAFGEKSNGVRSLVTNDAAPPPTVDGGDVMVEVQGIHEHAPQGVDEMCEDNELPSMTPCQPYTSEEPIHVRDSDDERNSNMDLESVHNHENGSYAVGSSERMEDDHAEAERDNMDTSSFEVEKKLVPFAGGYSNC